MLAHLFRRVEGNGERSALVFGVGDLWLGGVSVELATSEAFPRLGLTMSLVGGTTTISRITQLGMPSGGLCGQGDSRLAEGVRWWLFRILRSFRAGKALSWLSFSLRRGFRIAILSL